MKNSRKRTTLKPIIIDMDALEAELMAEAARINRERFSA